MDHGRPPVAEEDKDDQDDQEDRRTYRVDDVADRLAHCVGGVECDLGVHSRREFFREAVEFSDGTTVNIERIRGGKLRDADADCILPVELQVRAVILGA